jgi:hypothetical protein
MVGVDVHEHPPSPFFFNGSHPVGVHVDPLRTCQEVSANGYRIEVEWHDVRLRIMVMMVSIVSCEIREQQAGCLEKLKPRLHDGCV